MLPNRMRVFITGADGFIGKNLTLRLSEIPGVTVTKFLRGDDRSLLANLVRNADAVVHLAGENRPQEEEMYKEVNEGLTHALCTEIRQNYQSTGRYVPLILASSTQAGNVTPYGRSKLAAEAIVQELAVASGNPCLVYRLPGVFGKWCRPNYNSVVATFCFNISRGLPVNVRDAGARLRLVYIDDVVSAFISSLRSPGSGFTRLSVEPEYCVSLGELVSQITLFNDCRSTLLTERVGAGFVRSLYSTYISYLPENKFSYDVPQYVDGRGVFVEMLKTLDSGQFSFFTAKAGVTRGGHYHHTKSEKFLVIKGEALFRFRDLLTNKVVELRTDGRQPRVVDTIPGWTHDITNVGEEEMVVMLWANENFDRQRPDTVPCRVANDE
jgi:UDP-2-acetamido-2,6-beta-L-arabino-hexul-4-ose reductase